MIAALIVSGLAVSWLVLWFQYEFIYAYVEKHLLPRYQSSRNDYYWAHRMRFLWCFALSSAGLWPLSLLLMVLLLRSEDPNKKPAPNPMKWFVKEILEPKENVPT